MKVECFYLILLLCFFCLPFVALGGKCELDLYCSFFYQNAPKAGTNCQSTCWNDAMAKSQSKDSNAICFCGKGNRCSTFREGIPCLAYKNVGCLTPDQLVDCGWKRQPLNSNICLELPPQVRNCTNN
eukprot:TRINITY_DN3880_c0_g1_i1.p1 TRINITY_DN3880_c0_g1~~TRINITY_DN3880_c0_g1_i1.p1  ORF type:complete len:127 (+),score=34.28 TRINITY_DN3880_c0_g1_i1:163-543(+)